MKMISKDLTHTEEGLTTVLRSASEGKLFIVAQGKSWYEGLSDNYQEFNCSQSALNYFNSLIG